jgi:hypothetical protein
MSDRRKSSRIGSSVIARWFAQPRQKPVEQKRQMPELFHQAAIMLVDVLAFNKPDQLIDMHLNHFFL